MTHMEENIIEVAWLYATLFLDGRIEVDDSINGKLEILDIAREFEKEYSNVYWDGGENDYYREIENFAADKLINKFGVKNQSD